jgi:hypothetical protein
MCDAHLVVVLVMTTDHKSIRVICDIAKTTVSQLKARVYELTSCDDILDYYGVKLEDMSKSLRGEHSDEIMCRRNLQIPLKTMVSDPAKR